MGNKSLAPVYDRVLALRDAGLSDEAIADALGMSVEAVPALTELAARKRANHTNADIKPNEAST